MSRVLGFIGVLALLCVILSGGSVPSKASGGSGGGGGGSTVFEVRVTGYITSIDYVNSTVTVGASYYGTGVLNVVSTTKISLDNVGCDLSSLRVGDWAEARYDYYTKNAIKLTCISM